MQTMRAAFQVPIGFSDHTQGVEISIAAVALGAAVIEKHLTTDRSLPGPDHRASLEPDEFGDMVKAIRNVESALGDGRKVPAASEENTAKVARRSAVAAIHITSGVILTAEMVAFKRPGTGISASRANQLVGRCARRDIPEGALLQPDMFE
jgi:N-acetylneuraminate synthase/N,N'-diacetyllegionaminate synthase